MQEQEDVYVDFSTHVCCDYWDDASQDYVYSGHVQEAEDGSNQQACTHLSNNPMGKVLSVEQLLANLESIQLSSSCKDSTGRFDHMQDHDPAQVGLFGTKCVAADC